MANSSSSRRQLLTLCGGAAAGLGGLAGCVNKQDKDNNPPLQTDTGRIYYVSPDGSDGNAGTPDSPLNTIIKGVDRSQPGDTVYLLPGEHRAKVRTVRSGTADAPITITGPPEAVWRPPKDPGNLCSIAHSHIHITGITMDGLVNPSRSGDLDAYADGIVRITPWTTHGVDEFDPVDELEGVVFEPSRIGNSAAGMISVTRLRNASIGGFKVTGLAGAHYHPDINPEVESHVGEIIYIGTSVDDLGRYPWDSLDRSRNIRIHDIDLSEGYHHSQFVDLKLGTENITVENCVVRGSGRTTDGVEAAAIELKGNNCTVRWNDIGDCRWGVIFGAWVPDQADHIADAGNWGQGHRVYRNHIHSVSETPFLFYGEERENMGPTSPNEQGLLCGNNLEDIPADQYSYATGACGDDVM